MNTIPRRLKKSDLFRVFLRSFFIQSAWNYRSLISVGFCVALIPVIKKLYTGGDSGKACLVRHFKFFNSHPYMASYALGISAHLEEKATGGDSDACGKLERMKDLLVGPLGAVGDKLFWYTIKPYSLILGVVLIMLAGSLWLQYLALMFVFVLYNVPHLAMRWSGLVQGYLHGPEIYRTFQSQRFQRISSLYRYAGIGGFILFLANFLRTLPQEQVTDILVLPGLIICSALVHISIRNSYLTILITLMLAICAGIVTVNT